MGRSKAASEAALTRPYRSGFVGIVGRPNVGKSTLMNVLLGEKVAITSPRPQTTRTRILGVLTRADAQLMFLDTPGLHEPQHALGRCMAEAAKAVIDEADLLVVVVDARAGITDEDERVFARVRSAARPALLAINKVDAVKKALVLPMIERARQVSLFAEFVPISALTGEQTSLLLERMIAHLPEGPRWYEPEQRTDQPLTQRISELIREPLLLATRQEVPHALAVRIDQIEEKERVTTVHATILVDRPGHKAIVIGKRGATLKQVGQAARQAIERLVGRRVYLTLWVKVTEGWRSDERILRELGYPV